MSETFECPKCGYQWKQGQHGGHSCSDRLLKQLKDAKIELNSVLVDWNAIVSASGSKTHVGAVGHFAQMRTELEAVKDERDALRARIEAAEKQEAFACYVGEGFIKYPAMNIESIKLAADKFKYGFVELYTMPPMPAHKNAIPEFLLEMSQQMRTQDSRSTSHPFWQVRCHRYIPTEQGYNDHHWEICGDEGVIYRSTEEIELLQDYLIENHSEFLNARNEYHDAVDIGEWLRDDINEDDLPDGLRMIYVQQVEEVVSTHFTEHDARGFIERQQHNYPKLYTYVESAYWSPQIRKLQDWIISLTAERQNG